MRFAALIVLIAALLCASASAAAPMPNAAVACSACAQLAADAQDEVARQTVFAASCANVVAAQAQDTDNQETLAHMHSACVAEQSIMLDPKMLCAEVLRCEAAATSTAAVRPMAVEATQDQMPCDACIAKLVGKGVPADDAPKICMKVLKCIPNAVPTQAAPTKAAPTAAAPTAAAPTAAAPTAAVPTVAPATPTGAAPSAAPVTTAPGALPTAPPPPRINPMAVQAAEDKLPCDVCIAKLTAKDVPADDAAKICTKVLKCVPAAAPTAAPKATTAVPKATTAAPKQAFDAALNIPCDKCIAEGVEHGADADDAAFVCMKVLKCKQAAKPTQVAPTKAAPTKAAPTAAPVAPGTAAPSAAPVAPTTAPGALPTAPPPPRVALATAVMCDKCIAELTEHADADDAAFVCQKVLKCQKAAAPALAADESKVSAAAAAAPSSSASASTWFSEHYATSVVLLVVAGLALVALARFAFVKCCQKPLLQTHLEEEAGLEDFSHMLPAISYGPPSDVKLAIAEAEAGESQQQHALAAAAAALNQGGSASEGAYAPLALAAMASPVADRE